jgi:uncharacterized OsmC-like protein
MSTPKIREAIDTLSVAFSAEPAKARAKNAPATARLNEGLQFEVTGPYDARIVTDMPPAMGGAATGPNPGWFLRAALASCTATAIAMRAAKLGITLQTLELTVESESDTRGLLGLGDVSAALCAVRTKVKIRGNATPEALRELAAWGEAHSPVGCTLRQSADCSLDVEVV